jgi:hypothetical protein
MMKEFRENKDGVHLMYGEFTICGDSFDIAETEPDFEAGSLIITDKKTVTCQKCFRLILYCRGVRAYWNQK